MGTLSIVVDYLLEPLSFAFMQRGLLASVLVAIICGTLGSFVVLKGLAFIGDGLAHASFGGVALAFVRSEVPDGARVEFAADAGFARVRLPR